MLGWEFPPVINGGLGVACLGLSKGLSKFVDLTVILPKSDPTFIVENVALIGLNNIDLRQILKQDKKVNQQQNISVDNATKGHEEIGPLVEEIVTQPDSAQPKYNIKVRDLEQGKDQDPVTEYDTFAITEYVDIQIDPYHHVNKEIYEESTYIINLATKIGMGSGEEGVTGPENPAQPIVAAREHKSVFANAAVPSKESFQEEHEAIEQEGGAVEPDHLMIENFLHAFRDGELYGEDVIQKVILYSKYVLKIAAKKDFDIIYAHDWMTFLAGIEVKAKTGKPLALHVHALDYDRGGPDSKGWIFELEKFAMENADLIMPVSNYTASVVTGHYGIDPKKVFAVHNGADPVDVFSEEKGFPEKLVLFLGRVTGQKGPEFFLEVASKVFENYPKVRFVVAGTGDKLKRLIETGSYREIGHKFHFTGFLNKEKVHKLLAMTDVYCMPSVSEPFGLTALEAAQFGVPMVISKQSGVSEVLGGALSADYWDVNLMAEHIISLLKSKRLSSKVVKQSNEDLKNLTWDIAAEKIYNNFLKVLS
ncbi:MAG: glycosyltransferase family 4 protein [Bacteroidota bacterium]|nr:glycosyltransferase family 4 protein [Bacteroidota bacterium]